MPRILTAAGPKKPALYGTGSFTMKRENFQLAQESRNDYWLAPWGTICSDFKNANTAFWSSM